MDSIGSRRLLTAVSCKYFRTVNHNPVAQRLVRIHITKAIILRYTSVNLRSDHIYTQCAIRTYEMLIFVPIEYSLHKRMPRFGPHNCGLQFDARRISISHTKSVLVKEFQSVVAFHHKRMIFHACKEGVMQEVVKRFQHTHVCVQINPSFGVQRIKTYVVSRKSPFTVCDSLTDIRNAMVDIKGMLIP